MSGDLISLAPSNIQTLVFSCLFPPLFLLTHWEDKETTAAKPIRSTTTRAIMPLSKGHLAVNCPTTN